MTIEELLKKSVEIRASDLHILPNSQPLVRIDGELIPLQDSPSFTNSAVKEMLYALMTTEQQQKFERKLTLDMALIFPNIGNFRVSVIHQIGGISIVFRVISDKVPTFEDLLLPAVFKKLLSFSSGLILVTGPTGSGKSTTLAAMIDHINSTRTNHIITIEDPIEYVYTRKKCAINQIQVGRDTPDASTALRAALRHDPDVIMVGEMRDLETISLALTAAETGHLVLATLHASSAPFAVSRIIDVFPVGEKNRVSNLLSETLQGVICQTLVKKITGGRIAAFEIMLANPAIRHLIRQDMTSHMTSTIQTNGDSGMCTLDQYLQELVAKRLITTATARNTSLAHSQLGANL